MYTYNCNFDKRITEESKNKRVDSSAPSMEHKTQVNTEARSTYKFDEAMLN
jgi:hypothetical protein